MNKSYSDIRSRLGAPLWWDNNAVPRYEPFSPDMAGVYDKWVALCEIGCQGCRQFLLVGIELGDEVYLSPNPFWQKAETFRPTVENLWRWAYGDPPAHNCVGDTMASYPVRIIEFWEKQHGEWKRLPEHEVEGPRDISEHYNRYEKARNEYWDSLGIGKRDDAEPVSA